MASILRNNQSAELVVKDIMQGNVVDPRYHVVFRVHDKQRDRNVVKIYSGRGVFVKVVVGIIAVVFRSNLVIKLVDGLSLDGLLDDFLFDRVKEGVVEVLLAHPQHDRLVKDSEPCLLQHDTG